MLRLFEVAACAAVFALIAKAETPLPRPVLPLIGVYMNFDHVPEGVSVQVMERAVENILKPSGVQLVWRLTKENAGREAFAGLAVLNFKGLCQVRAPRPVSGFGSLGETLALASTEEVSGHILPYTDVECDEVRKSLAHVGPGARLPERQQALGLALGRVVAHELYHILANTAAHASEGLGKASQLLQDLISSQELSFDQATANAIHQRFYGDKKDAAHGVTVRGTDVKTGVTQN